MAALPDDLILEIISNLPLKFLVQCKCLNQNFNLFISDPVFQSQHALRSSTTFDCLLQYANLYKFGAPISKVDLRSHDRINAKVPELRRRFRSMSLPTILSSSGGLLLLEFRFLCQCVFNPITGAYRFIPSPEEATYISLVSQLSNPSSYELVAVCMQIVENKLCYVFKIFDYDASNWRISCSTCSSNQIKLIDQVYQTAYLDDSVYWLNYKDSEILVFNVKTEQAKIINQPEDLQNNRRPSRTWFGVIQDKLTILAINNATNNKISIYNYESVHGKWKIDKLLDDILYPNYMNGKGYSYPVFYDGKRLIQMLVTAEGRRNELYIYDVVDNSSRKIKTMPDLFSDTKQTFCHFFGTFAKIPHCSYLHEMRKHELEEQVLDILEILFCIQQYLSSDIEQFTDADGGTNTPKFC